MRKKAIQKEIIPVSYQRDILLYRGKIVFNSSVYYHNSMGKSKCFFSCRSDAGIMELA